MSLSRQSCASDAVIFDSVTKVFRPQVGLFNWMGRGEPRQTVALSSVSLIARKAEVLVLLGPNGSGKTTLLRLASGALFPESGSVLVNGMDTVSDSRFVHKIVAHAVGVDRSFFPRLTVEENLIFFSAFDDVPRSARKSEVERVLAATGIKNFRDTLAMKLSSGTYQRLGIARALLKQPAVLLLDEPTRSLDPAAVELFWPLVREIAASGVSVIVASHNFQEAVGVGDSVAVLFEGVVVANKLFRKDQTVEELREFYFELTGSDRSVELDRKVGV